MFRLKLDRCTNCRICQLACVWGHDGKNGVSTARIGIGDNWPEHPDISICLACKSHKCVEACPEDALSWEKWILLDTDKCTGCQNCVTACPVAGVHWDITTDLPLICDTCSGMYACIKWCPTGAIKLRGAK